MKRNELACIFFTVLVAALVLPASLFGLVSPAVADSQDGLGLQAGETDFPPVMNGLSAIGVGQEADFIIDYPVYEDGWTWSSSDNSIATISPTQSYATKVQGLSAGTVTIRAENGDMLCERKLAVVNPTMKGPDSLAVGASAEFEIEGYPAGQWEWSGSGEIEFIPDNTSNPVTVKLTDHAMPGEYRLKATLRTNSEVYVATDLRVAQNKISDDTVSIQGVTDLPYTGQPVVQSDLQVALRDHSGPVELELGKDYEVEYANNVDLGAVATVTIKGIGDYAGTATKTFKIYSAFDAAEVAVQNADSIMYNGGVPLEPSVQVTLGDEVLDPENYTVTYSNNVNAGDTALVTVEGKGAYVGTKQVNYTIKPASLHGAVVTALAQEYSGSALEPTPAVKYGDRTLQVDKDFEVVGYANNINVGNSAIVYVNGMGNYAGVTSGAFVINKASLGTLVLSEQQYTYDGTAKTPTLIVKNKQGQVLHHDTHEDHGAEYEIVKVPEGRTDVGTYTYRVAGTGNYTGTLEASYKIVGAGISSASLSTASYTYDGSVKSPAVTVKGPGNKALKEGVDYSVSRPSGRTNAGSYAYTVKGINNYSGTKTLKMTVNKASLASAKMTLSTTSYSYDKKAHKPSVKVVLGGKTLRAGTDYTLSYKNNVKVGKATVTVTGKGNYSGSKSLSFTIKTSSIWDAQVNHRVKYQTHVQNIGWQKYVNNGATAGTSGRSLRLEAIRIALMDKPYSGGIQYRTHIQNIGWEKKWKSNRAMSGTSGRSLRLEAIQIKLTGAMASHYDVYYRVHCQNIGWMGWAKNGARAGTAGHSYRLEAIQIKLVPKGGKAPGSMAGAFRQR